MWYIKYCVFSLKRCDFSELSTAAALVYDLPSGAPRVKCTHTEKGQSPEYILESLKKHNI